MFYRDQYAFLIVTYKGFYGAIVIGSFKGIYKGFLQGSIRVS